MKFAHSALYSWRESMLYAEKFGAGEYDKQPAKWIEAWAYFDRVSAEMRPLVSRGGNQDLTDIKRQLDGFRKTDI
jgi:hypothetical protein